MLRQRKNNRIGCWQNDPLGLTKSIFKQKGSDKGKNFSAAGRNKN